MKKYLLFSLGMMFLMGSCIYEDGPKMSLRSKKARAVNVWYIDKAYEDGVDRTEDYRNFYINYRLEIRKDDSYKLNYQLNNIGMYIENGNWKFSDDKGSILFTPSGTTQENKFKILRLKNSEAWVSQEANGKTIEFHFKD